jgi:hypothetical protein
MRTDKSKANLLQLNAMEAYGGAYEWRWLHFLDYGSGWS